MKALGATGKIEIGAAAHHRRHRERRRWSRITKAPMFTEELAEGTQTSQRSLIERFRGEHGDKRLRMLERRHVQAYISSLESRSGSAQYAARVEALSQILHRLPA